MLREAGTLKDIAAGASLGALIGVLIGLSVSDVVGSVVAALVALLATFFGLQSDTGRTFASTPNRIASFSVVALLALFAGVYLRTNDTLSPDLVQRADAWQNVGFRPKVAAQLVAFERLGVAPEAWLTSDTAVEASTMRSSVLFASKGAASCIRLAGRNYADADSIAEAMKVEGGAWAKLVDSWPANTPETTREAILRFAIVLLCEVEE